MSGIAEVLLTLGYKVTGSDVGYSDSIRRLEELGGTVYIGHQEANVEGAQVVVVSSAIAHSNPEIRAARAKVIPVIPRRRRWWLRFSHKPAWIRHSWLGGR